MIPLTNFPRGDKFASHAIYFESRKTAFPVSFLGNCRLPNAVTSVLSLAKQLVNEVLPLTTVTCFPHHVIVVSSMSISIIIGFY